jgi:serine/threonine protein kinase
MYQLEPGSEFAGFVIEGVIGTGGMSVLYRARDPQLQRVVALKIMSAALSEDDDFRRRFAEEARLAAAIDHPNVVPIYGFGQVGESLYIAMRYVPGTDLRKLLRVESSLAPARISDLLGQVAAALDVVHRRGMVHRDVKPDNVLITPPAPPDHLEYAYLADFGLTRSDTQSRITQAGQIVGTLAYAAPEQLRGEEVSGAADVYSLGCVLFECLVGDRPFRRNNDASVIYAHLHDPPPKVTEVRPDLPASLDGVIARALAKEPEARFGSAGDLLRAYRVAVGLEAGPVTSEISLEAIAQAAPDAGPPVEVWAVPDGSSAPDAITVVRSRRTTPPDQGSVDARVAASTSDDNSTPTPTPHPPAAVRPTERSSGSRRILLVGVTVLVLGGGAIAAVALRSSGDGGTGSGTTTTTHPVEGPGVIVDQDGKVLSTDPDVKMFRTIGANGSATNEMTVSLRVANRSSHAVVVVLLERIPRSLVRGGVQVRRVDPDPRIKDSVPTSIASGGTVSGMDLSFEAAIDAGADAVFEYVVVLGAPVVDEDLQRWAQELPAVPDANVEVPGTTTSSAGPVTVPPASTETLVTG